MDTSQGTQPNPPESTPPPQPAQQEGNPTSQPNPPTPPSQPPQPEKAGKKSFKLLFLLSAVLIAVGVLLVAYFVTGNKTTPPQQQSVAKKPTIKLAVNPWKASELNAMIAKILLEEKMGYSVQLVNIDEFKQWPSLAKGDIHAALEVWPSGHKDDITKYIVNDKSVIDGGLLGPVGKIGWYIPKYLVTEHPDLATWEGFKDPKNTVLFASASGKGQFYTGDPTWTQYDDQIIKNLTLPFEVQTLGSEDALIKKVDELYTQKKAVVFYFWTPHWAHAVYDLVPVELPVYNEDCYKDLKSGVNCDYPKDPLQKVFWSGLEGYAPDAYQFLKKFNYTNEDQIRMLAALQLKKQSTEEAARNWINNNEAVWQLWIQESK